MAFVRLAFFPGATEAVFRALEDRLAAAPVPQGRRVFAAGPLGGGWQVVQVWDRKEDLDAFNASSFGPALATLGTDGFPYPPEVTDFETAQFSVAAPPPDESRSSCWEG